MTARLNPLQEEVLAWIVAGCPDGVMTGATYKTSAVALQNRGLVRVRRTRHGWSAQPTDAGRAHTIAEAPARPARGSQPDPPPGAERPAPSARVAASPRPPRRAPVEQMIAHLTAAGGELCMTGDDPFRVRAVVSAAHRFHKVPDGHMLTLEWAPGGATVRLRKAPAWMLPTVRDVPVPDTLRPCHPTVRALREDPRRLPMKRDLRQRALLILDALALEAERRGHRVDPPPPQTYSRRRQGALPFTVAGHAFRIDLTETQHQVPVPAAADARRGRGSWAGRPTDRVEGTGLLRVTVLDGLTYHCDAVQDTAATPLEAKLGQVLHEVEARSVLAEDRRREREQEEAERRARWAPRWPPRGKPSSSTIAPESCTVRRRTGSTPPCCGATWRRWPPTSRPSEMPSGPRAPRGWSGHAPTSRPWTRSPGRWSRRPTRR